MKTHFLKPGDNKEVIENLSSLFRDDADLLIAVAYFNNEYFADLIIERAKKKQKTLLLLNTSDLVRPKEAGKSEIVISKALIKILEHEGQYVFCKSLGLRSLGNYQNMHHKFILNKNKLFFGSLNLTDAAINRNFESLLETESKFLIRDFYNEFEQLWKIGSELFCDRDGKLRSIMCPKCEMSDGVDFESFGPICHMCGYQFIVE